jgi:hypothetical protein
MSDKHDPAFCYKDDIESALRREYFSPHPLDFRYENVTWLLSSLMDRSWIKELSLLNPFLTTASLGVDAGSVLDIRYRGKPNTRELYDIILLPSFNTSARQYSLALDGDHVFKLDWVVFTAKEFFPFDVSPYMRRFQLHKNDYNDIRFHLVRAASSASTSLSIEGAVPCSRHTNRSIH